MSRGRKIGVDPIEMLLYLDESIASEKVMFRKRSQSQIGLLAYIRLELMSKVRYSVLPTLDVNGYIPRSTLVVEGAITQAIYEHQLETVVLPQSELFPGRRSIVVIDNYSTYYSDKVGAKFSVNWLYANMRQITQLGREFSVHLLYLPPYLLHLNPIKQTFYLLKQQLRKQRNLAPRVDEIDIATYKAAQITHLEQASHQSLNDVNIRNLFKRS